ncbi:MAG TPA: arsenite efflux transporter metallochaperone ArsD [Gillisia sp.]|nr:arsenite efflux transporter metallochaperone ArsD [Gillisia sp.]
MKFTILDPALCCSTGVCGPEVDDNLVQTAANVKWIKSLGVEVARHNVSNDGEAFQQYPEAIEKLKMDGLNSLPYILKDGKIVLSGRYPSKTEWDTLLKTETAPVMQNNPSCCGGTSCC